MAEPIRLQLIVENDQAIPALQAAQQAVIGIVPPVTQAATSVQGFSTVLDDHRRFVEEDNKAWGALSAQWQTGSARAQDNAAAVKQVETALVSFTARVDVAENNTTKLQAAVNHGELAFAKLSLSVGPQAAQAMDRFAAAINATKDRLDTLPPSVDKNAAAIKQVETALASFQARSQVAGTDTAKLQSAISQGEQAFAKLSITTKGQAEPALAAFRQELDATRARADQLGGGFGTLVTTGAQLALGFSTVAGALLAAKVLFIDGAGAAITFQDALTKINVVLAGQTALQATYRDALLALPSLYGNATERAEALQRVLSTGFTKPAEALDVLTTALRLNTAGFGDLDTTTKLIIHTHAVYGEQVRNLALVSDIYIDAIQRGGATLTEFGKAFPVVLEAAKQLGVSFEDSVDAFVFLNPLMKDVGRTTFSLDQIFRGLAKSQDELAARGVDLRKILGPGGGGLQEVWQRLNELTNGNADALKALVPNMRNIEALLALVREGSHKAADAEQRHADMMGKTDAALRERTASWTVEWKNITNTVSDAFAEMGQRAAEEIQRTRQWFSLLSTNFTITGNAISDVLGLSRKMRDETERTAASQQIAADSWERQGQAIEKAKQAFYDLQLPVAELPITFEAANAAIKQFEAGLKILSSHEIFPQAQLDTTVKNIIDNLIKMANSAEVNFAQLEHFGLRAATVLKERLGVIPAELLPIFVTLGEKGAAALTKMAYDGTVPLAQVQTKAAELRKTLESILGVVPAPIEAQLRSILLTADTSALGIHKAFSEAGIKTRADLALIAEAALARFETIRASNQATTADIHRAWETAKAAVIAQLGFLPPAMEATNRQLLTSVEHTVEGIMASYRVMNLKTGEELRDDADRKLAHFLNLWNQTGAAAEKAATREIAAMHDASGKIIGFSTDATGAQALNWSKTSSAAEKATEATLKVVKDQTTGIVRITSEGLAQTHKDTSTTYAEMTKAYDAMVAAQLAAYGKLRPGMAEIGKQLHDQAKLTADGVTAAFTTMGQKTLEVLDRANILSVKDFNTMAASGQASAQAIKAGFERESIALLSGSFSKIGPAAQSMFDAMLRGGSVTTAQMRGFFEKMAEDELRVFGQVSPEIQTILAQLGAQVDRTTAGAAASFARMGIANTEAVRLQVESNIKDMQNILAKGGGIPAELAHKWEEMVTKILAGGEDMRIRMGPLMETLANQIIQTFERAKIAIPQALLDAIATMRTQIPTLLPVTKTTTDEMVNDFNNVSKAIAGSVQVLGQFDLHKLMADVPTDLKSLTKALQEAQDQLKAMVFNTAQLGELQKQNVLGPYTALVDKLAAALKTMQADAVATAAATGGLTAALGPLELQQKQLGLSLHQDTQQWDQQIQAVTLLKNQLSLVLVADQQHLALLQRQDSALSLALQLTQDQLAAAGQSSTTDKTLLTLQVEHDRLTVERDRLVSAGASTQEVDKQLAGVAQQITAENNLLKLASDQNALANVGLEVQKAQLKVEEDKQQLLLKTGLEAVAQEDDILGKLNAQKQVLLDMAAIRLAPLNQEVALMQEELSIAQQQLALSKQGVGLQPLSVLPSLAPTETRIPFTPPAATPPPASGLFPLPGARRSFQEGGVVPYDMVALVHQGETIMPAVGQGPPRGGDTHVTLHVTIPVTLPPGMSRIDAQMFVSQITPALNEAIRRKQVRLTG